MTTRTRDPKAPAGIPPGQWTFAGELVEPQPATGKRNVLAAMRAAFPDAGPATLECDGPEWRPYCVGGVVRAYAMGEDLPDFPEQGLIASALMVLNPDLEELEASHFALEIIAHNDAGALERSWETVATALAWPLR